ncbi:MAG: hypothetical protein R2708_14945 [Vicinamibacterales bacterium]
MKGVKAICALIMDEKTSYRSCWLTPTMLGCSSRQASRVASIRATKSVPTRHRLCLLPKSEIEDLFPPLLVAKIVDRFLTKPADSEEDFVDVLKAGEPIVPQVERYAANHQITLDEGWKVDIAKRVKAAMVRSKDDPLQGADTYVDAWKKLFSTLHPTR